MEHTKGKWKVKKNQIVPVIVIENKKTAIAIFGDTPLKEAEANACRICQCVNSHDDLLAACNEALEVFEDLGVDPTGYATHAIMRMLKQALAKTENAQDAPGRKQG